LPEYRPYLDRRYARPAHNVRPAVPEHQLTAAHGRVVATHVPKNSLRDVAELTVKLDDDAVVVEESIATLVVGTTHNVLASRRRQPVGLDH
jgi:hypothetical protein